MKNYKPLLSFLIFIILLAVPPLALKYTGNNDLLTPGFWMLFFFVSFLTLLATLFILAVQAKNGEMYAPAFMGATGFKLLVCLILVLIFIKKMHPDKIIFVVDFMYLYFLNMAFEIYGLLRNLRNQNLR